MIGSRVREIRRDQGLSLRDLAAAAGLTPSFLSQLERGLTEPSISSLRRIAEGLNTPIFYFLLDGEQDHPVVRKHERRRLKFPGGKANFEILTPGLNFKMEIITAVLEPGGATCDAPLEHPGEEFLLVSHGEAAVEVGGQEYHLESGDSIYYMATIPHRVSNRGTGRLEFVMALTPPNLNPDG